MTGFATNYRAYQAEAAVIGYRIVKPGSADMTCVQAAGPTEALMGTSDSLDKATGEMVDVSVGAIDKVRLGGTVTRGAALTSDASGKAVATTTIGHRIIGFAELSGVVDDLITYRIAPGVL